MQALWIQVQDRWIGDPDAWIQAQEAWIQVQDRWIGDPDAWIQAQDLWIQAQALWIADPDAWIGDQAPWIEDQEAWIEAQNLWIFGVKRKILGAKITLGLLIPLGRVQQFCIRAEAESDRLNDSVLDVAGGMG